MIEAWGAHTEVNGPDGGSLGRIDDPDLEMFFTKILPDMTAVDALSALVTERSRRVFSFCADWLFDPAPACVMQHLVSDRPHLVFHVGEARPHMKRDVALFYGCGLDDTEAALARDRAKAARDEAAAQLETSRLRHQSDKNNLELEKKLAKYL